MTLLVSMLVLSLAIIVGAWAWDARHRPELFHTRQDLLWQATIGETFTPQQMDRLRTPCGSYHRNTHPKAAHLAVTIAVRDVELSLLVADPEELSRLLACAEDATRQLLAVNPSSSFGWLAMGWLARMTNPAKASAFIDRSVAMAPRDLWMGLRRAPIMETEVVLGRADAVRGDYRMLAEGERPRAAARLLRACVLRDPLCETDWNAGLTDRQQSMVWREMVRLGEE